MKVRLSDIRAVIKEELEKLEDIDRLRRAADGYGDMSTDEDLDRVRRAADGYGDMSTDENVEGMGECGDMETPETPFVQQALPARQDMVVFPMISAVDEVTPPGMEKVVKTLKQNPDVENPYALANWIHDKQEKQDNKDKE